MERIISNAHFFVSFLARTYYHKKHLHKPHMCFTAVDEI